MQSSTGMYLRAVVMLACLIAVPLVALFGNKFPDLAKKTLGERWDRISSYLPGASNETPARDSSANPGAPAMANVFGSTPNAPQGPPPFAPQGFAGNNGPSGAPITWGPPPTATPGPGGFGNPAAAPSPAPRPPAEALLASYNEPATAPQGVPVSWQGQPGPNQGQSAGLNPGRPASPAPLGAMPGQTMPVPAPSSPYSQGPASAALSSPPSADRFSEYQRRVRELGGVYSLLETWGDRGQLFRFYCKVAVAGNADCTRYFEAIDADPMAAMGKVIQQVEAWRSSLR